VFLTFLVFDSIELASLSKKFVCDYQVDYINGTLVSLNNKISNSSLKLIVGGMYDSGSDEIQVFEEEKNLEYYSILIHENCHKFQNRINHEFDCDDEFGVSGVWLNEFECYMIDGHLIVEMIEVLKWWK